MFHPSSNTARTHAHSSISTLKSLVNFCSRDFLFHREFDDSTLAKRHIVVGHFVRSDTSHVMHVTDVKRHSRITQQLVSSTIALSFVCCSQFACKKKVAHDFRYDLVSCRKKYAHTTYQDIRNYWYTISLQQASYCLVQLPKQLNSLRLPSKNRALLDYQAAGTGNYLPTFRDK